MILLLLLGKLIRFGKRDSVVDDCLLPVVIPSAAGAKVEDEFYAFCWVFLGFLLSISHSQFRSSINYVQLGIKCLNKNWSSRERIDLLVSEAYIRHPKPSIISHDHPAPIA